MVARITWMHTLYTTLLALWLGTFVAVGGLVVPMLFSHLPTHIAADTAVVIFKLQGLLGFVVLALLLACLYVGKLRALPLEIKFLTTVLLGACLLQFWVIPELLAQRTLAVKQPLWHIASSALYLLQAVCVLIVFVQRVRKPTLYISRSKKTVKTDTSDSTGKSVVETALQSLTEFASDAPPVSGQSNAKSSKNS
jgi:hypothetical protein